MDGPELSKMADRTAAAEANHRIANNLAFLTALIRSQAAKLPHQPSLPVQDVHSLLQKMSLRVDAVGRLHRLLTQANRRGEIDLAVYLWEIVEAATSSFSGASQNRLSVDLEPDFTLQANQATAVGLIVGEAITNALKYSHPTGVPGKIRIASKRTKTAGMVIEVEDDGIGLPEAFNPDKSQSMGLSLMRRLAGQLGASLAFKQQPIGLCVRLELPSPK
jgi:two-component system, sensor histidine kinase PdtaS